MKKIILLLLTVLFFSCQKESKNSNNKRTIDLEFKSKNKPLGISSQTRSILYMNSIPKEFKGIIKRDSSLIGYMNIIYKSQLDKLYQNDEISELQYNNVQTKIYCLSGYNNGKQFFIVDLNNNKDFSDDKVVEFNKSLSKEIKDNWKNREKLPTYEVEVSEINNNKIRKRKLAFLIYPKAGSYRVNSKTQNPEIKNKLNLSVNLRDYLYGEFKIDNKEFKVSVSNYGFRGVESIFREKDSAFYAYGDLKYYTYNISDTIKIDNEYYNIDTISVVPPKLTLEKLSMKSKVYGFRMEDKIRDYSVENLEGSFTNLSSLFGKNEYLLIDFWGTWCAPCKELTPDLIALNARHKNKISLISLAHQNEVEPIKKYIQTNKMNWYHGIIKGNPKSNKNKPAIIKQLRVEAFPTFLILNKDLKIVYRTYGMGSNFNKMVKFIDKLK